MEVTIDLLDVAKWFAVYYVAGFCIVLISAVRLLITSKSPTRWRSVRRKLLDPGLYVILPIWVFYFVGEMWSVIVEGTRHEN